MSAAQSPDWLARMQRQAAAARDPRLRRFYEAWQLPGSTPLRDVPLAALDLETTGMDPRRHSIVSIGIVPFDLGRIRFSQRRHWIVRPRFPLQALSVTLHHITHSDLAAAPDLGEVLGDVLDALAGRLPVVHYYPIERAFLDSALRFRLDEGIEFPVIDTMQLEARWYRQSLGARLRHWLGRRPVSIRLHESRLRYGLPAYQPHHAALDALATAELLQAQVAARFSPDTPVEALWC
ncbi:3'-5' exonuclease [Thioalkalivibrio sp. XN8]|uniref:3'-5' exonuclease n=1 Tax=Thioalkalivibrio sp. XN8 TaxID=2712863 RepID=UPI0013EC0202|nr:3'-5' exonuclease [Thioalkalivibrio sp. XN8]NGP54646.1 3'-5' exonuclease [Thioalkalivibrio sp. XN8]